MDRSRAIIKSKFEPWEDARLLEVVRAYGPTNWQEIAAHVPGRNARQCRERWSNYINPNLLKAEWTDPEDDILLRMYRELGPKWFVIAGLLPGRAKNSVKNRYFALQRRAERDSGNRSEYPMTSPSLSVPVKENPKPASDGIPEPASWPDSLHEEASFGWDFERGEHPFFDFF
jgi:hypothetical protein